MKKTFRLLNETIRNPNFTKVMELCFADSSFLSFTKYFGFQESARSKHFDADLQPFLVETMKTIHWHCYHMLDPNRPLEVSIYRATQAVKEIVLNTFGNIYLTDHIKPPIAEDICFFRENELLLGTVSHERICHVYPKTEHSLNAFLQSANWEETDFLEEELIRL